jgi:hypothetical protein
MGRKLKASCQKELLTEAELRMHFGSSYKYELSFRGTLYLIFGSVCMSLISPFLPSRFSPASRKLPSDWHEYFLEVENFLVLYILIVFLIGLGLLFESARCKLDKRLGYKLVVTRRITGIIRLPKRKLLILNSWIPFTLNERRLSFTNVKSGQLIQTVRTGTFKLLRYSIHSD